MIVFTLLVLGAVEGLAWWWMNPASADLGQPVLVYRPQVGRDPASAQLSPEARNADGQLEIRSQEEATAQNSPSKQQSTINNPQAEISSPNPQSPIRNLPSITPLPEVYRQAAPMLRCTSGQVFHVQIDSTAGLHAAFFEWNGTDTGSVLEAFRHLPEACMGSIGMELVSKEKPIPYTVDGETLLFDHTIFREPHPHGGLLTPDPIVHAFRAIWIAGVPAADARQGLDGHEIDRLRTIHLKAALTRFRPIRACVVQGAVRGMRNPDLAWQSFEENVLRDLHIERQR